MVVVDEAQQLNRECIEFLRYLHDHRLTRFALLLVGGDGTWQVLSREPMLRSRIYRRVVCEPLSGGQVCALLPRYHPIYATASADLLLFVDDHFAHGNLRDWASFTPPPWTCARPPARTGSMSRSPGTHSPCTAVSVPLRQAAADGGGWRAGDSARRSRRQPWLRHRTERSP